LTYDQRVEDEDDDDWEKKGLDFICGEQTSLIASSVLCLFERTSEKAFLT